MGISLVQKERQGHFTGQKISTAERKKLKQDFLIYLATSDPSLSLLKNWIQIETGSALFERSRALTCWSERQRLQRWPRTISLYVRALFDRDGSVGEQRSVPTRHHRLRISGERMSREEIRHGFRITSSYNLFERAVSTAEAETATPEPERSGCCQSKCDAPRINRAVAIRGATKQSGRSHAEAASRECRRKSNL